eukprot:1156611-Pelagomonas_calceolata.AAC.1
MLGGERGSGRGADQEGGRVRVDREGGGQREGGEQKHRWPIHCACSVYGIMQGRQNSAQETCSHAHMLTHTHTHTHTRTRSVRSSPSLAPVPRSRPARGLQLVLISNITCCPPVSMDLTTHMPS